MAYLTQQLDNMSEAGGTVLDHSIVVVSNDMNEGNYHHPARLPYVVIGSAGGYLKTGRVVKLGTWANQTGTYWSKDSGVANNKRLVPSGATRVMTVPGWPGTGAGAAPISFAVAPSFASASLMRDVDRSRVNAVNSRAKVFASLTAVPLL